MSSKKNGTFTLVSIIITLAVLGAGIVWRYGNLSTTVAKHIESDKEESVHIHEELDTKVDQAVNEEYIKRVDGQYESLDKKVDGVITEQKAMSKTMTEILFEVRKD